VKGGVKATEASKEVAQETKTTKSLAKAAESIEKGAARATKVEQVAQQAEGVEAGVAQAAKVEQAAQRAEGVEHTTKIAKRKRELRGLRTWRGWLRKEFLRRPLKTEI
jgi:UDP-N-acetylmuramyl tripeptide synthase